MSLPTLASSGAVVKIWNNLCHIQQLSPFDAKERVSSISWSPNCKYIVSCCDKGDKIAVTDVNCPSKFISLTPKDVTTFVSYSSTKNRSFLSCGQGATISLWDLQSRSIVKSLKTNVKGAFVKCATFDARDSCVACGLNNGTLVTINAVTTVAHSPMIYPNVNAITDIEFSFKQKNVLGTSSDDGGCNLWDYYENKRIHSFENRHSAPATGFSFSPVNEMLLATAGLDKVVQFYDSRSRKSIIKISTKEPLNCLDFTGDGQCIAVGSTRGSIFAYDLRSTNTPLGTIPNAHTGAVTAVLFEDVSNVGDDFIMDVTMREFSSSKLESKDNLNNNVNVSKIKWQVTSQSKEKSSKVSNTLSSNISIRQKASTSASHIAPALSFNASLVADTPNSQGQSPAMSMLSDSEINSTIQSPGFRINSLMDGSVNDTLTGQNGGADCVPDSCTVVSTHNVTDCSAMTRVTDASAAELESRLKDKLKESQRVIQNDISNIHIYCVRQFIKCEEAVEYCAKKLSNLEKKMDCLDSKLSAILEELRNQRRSNFQ